MPDPKTEEILKELRKLNEKIIPIVALAPIITQGLANIPSAETIKNAAASGTCQTLQPGGCSRKALDPIQNSAADAANNSKKASDKLDALNAALNGLDLAGVAQLNAKLDGVHAKLGPQIPNGGIAGKLGKVADKVSDVYELTKDKFNKLWKTFGLDRVLALLTFAASLHNAAMLSRELGETLVDTLESILRAAQNVFPDFLKNPDGENFDLDLEELFGKKIEEFLKNALGTDNYYNLKAKWMKANRILAAGGNMLSAMRGMQNAVTDGLEVVGGYVAKGFNGLQREGVVSDKTWAWMDETPKFKNRGITRFTEKLDDLDDAASSIQQIAESVTEFVEESNELVKNTTELKKALDEDTAKKAEEEAKKDKESESPDVDDNDTKRG